MVFSLSLLAEVAAASSSSATVDPISTGTTTPPPVGRKRAVTFAHDVIVNHNKRQFSPPATAPVAPSKSTFALTTNPVTSPSARPSTVITGSATANNTVSTVIDGDVPIRNISPFAITPLADIPADQRSIVVRAIKDVYGIDTPRPFQIEAINYLAFGDDKGRANILYMIRKTADGKSLVQLASSVIMRGVTITLVPLVGLGSDQVEKAVVIEKNVEGYHVDEHKYSDAYLLRQRIDLLTEDELWNRAVTLFISPQGLKTGSPWLEVIKTLTRRNHLSLFVIDEAYSIEQSM